MGALGHYIEREGIATAQISLIREQTAAIKPPRALWVPFMLGRPFGAPNEPAFQRRVLLHLLSLFDAAKGPVLDDFPDDAPADAGDAAGYVCPVNFERPESRQDEIAAALQQEIEQLAVWHDLARRRRGRSMVGIAGMPIAEAAQLVGSFLDGAPKPNPQPEAVLGSVLKRCCDDIKTYCFEALAAQPGQLSARAIDDWFWHQSAAGRAFLRLYDMLLAHPDASVVAFAERSLLPRAILHTRTERR